MSTLFLRPVAVFKYGICHAIFIACNFKVVRTNHKVHVNHTVVDTQRLTFFKAFILKAVNSIAEASAESNVTACIFIKQSIVEQNARFVDGRIVRNERYFAKHLAAFDTAFRAMDRAILEQDSDGFIHANAQLQQVLEYEPQFSSQQEFDDLMNDGDSFRL